MIQNNAMNETFWGLKDDWWKQIYDSEFHMFGPEVFDKGLHKHGAEPGYYASIKKSSQYASNELGKPLTIECYQMIHQLACEHFGNLDSRVINVSPENINKFRSVNCMCRRNIRASSYEDEAPNQLKKRKLFFELLRDVRDELMITHRIDSETWSKREFDALSYEIRQSVQKYFMENEEYKDIDVAKFFEEGIPEYENALQSVEELKKQLEETRVSLNLEKTFARISVINYGVNPSNNINYLYVDPKAIEDVVNRLFECYNARMSQLPSDPLQRNEEEKENALRNIAELYQNLEWLHPFFDGQGRTDLVLLSKLLTENGFNPSILFYPYFSTFEPLDKWVDYLKNGMRAWRDLRATL